MHVRKTTPTHAGTWPVSLLPICLLMPGHAPKHEPFYEPSRWLSIAPSIHTFRNAFVQGPPSDVSSTLGTRWSSALRLRVNCMRKKKQSRPVHPHPLTLRAAEKAVYSRRKEDQKKTRLDYLCPSTVLAPLALIELLAADFGTAGDWVPRCWEHATYCYSIICLQLVLLVAVDAMMGGGCLLWYGPITASGVDI
jgi:hypothetical protein